MAGMKEFANLDGIEDLNKKYEAKYKEGAGK